MKNGKIFDRNGIIDWQEGSIMEKKYFTIGKLARATGVHIETIRFYERKGLIPPPRRRESGYREYTVDDIRRLKFIQRAKMLGFSLREIQELLELRVDEETTCDAVRQRAELKIADVDARIQELQRIRQALKILVQSCYGKGPEGECPILHALEGLDD